MASNLLLMFVAFMMIVLAIAERSRHKKFTGWFWCFVIIAVLNITLCFDPSA